MEVETNLEERRGRPRVGRLDCPGSVGLAIHLEDDANRHRLSSGRKSDTTRGSRSLPLDA
jgi:hypothetical protein